MQPADAKRNQRAAIEDSDLDTAALWAEEVAGGMHDDTHDATAGYCDFDVGGDDWGDDAAEDWSTSHQSNAIAPSVATGGGFSGHGGASQVGGSSKPLLSPLAHNLAPAPVQSGVTKVCVLNEWCKLAHITFISDIRCFVCLSEQTSLPEQSSSAASISMH
jgi:hypothetical protein